MLCVSTYFFPPYLSGKVRVQKFLSFTVNTRTILDTYLCEIVILSEDLEKCYEYKNSGVLCNRSVKIGAYDVVRSD